MKFSYKELRKYLVKKHSLKKIADILLERRKILQQVLDILSPQERELLRLRFGFDEKPKSLREIAQSLGRPLTRECIRLREKKALEKIRHFIKKKFPELAISC